jgi:hypothetical protein
VDDLLSEMRRLGIERALVRHRVCLEASHEIGNALLMNEITGHDVLFPVWYVRLDGLEGELGPSQVVEQLLELGVRAAWTTLGGRDVPFLLDPWCSGKILSALERHRVPLLLSYGDVLPNTLREVLTTFPGLTIVLLEVPRLGRNPILYPLMEQHPNLVLCVSALYGVHLGLEDLCKHFGDDRIVFGSTYPKCEGGASVAALTYAELPSETKEAIAGRNLERILKGVRA